MSAMALLEAPIVEGPAAVGAVEEVLYEVVDGHLIETPTMSY